MTVEKTLSNGHRIDPLWVSHKIINRAGNWVARKRHLWVLCKSEADA